MRIVSFVFFFFQAEDGIRDADVTGVQTCALPICQCYPGPTGSAGTVTSITLRNPWGPDNTGGNPYVTITPANLAACQIWVAFGNTRSEERRVGKECRSGRSRGQIRIK